MKNINKSLFYVILKYGQSNGYNAKNQTFVTKYKGFVYLINYLDNKILKCWKIISPFENREINFKQN